MAEDDEIEIIVEAVEIIDGVEVPIGEPRVRTISRGALDLLHGNVSPLDDRRQRVREAFYDRAVLPEGEDGHAIEIAIETAIRVQVTPEIKDACVQATGYGYDIPSAAYDDIIGTAFRAAGFEVEQ